MVFFLQQGVSEGETIDHALLVAVEDQEGRIEVAALEVVIELEAVALELMDITGEEITARRIEIGEVAVEKHRRQIVVEFEPVVMQLLEAFDHGLCRDGHVAVGHEIVDAQIRRAAGAGMDGGDKRESEEQ